MEGGGKLSKLKAKLAEITSQIDDADSRKSEAKTGMIDALSRLEKGESEVASIERRILLLQQDLDDVSARCEISDDKLGEVQEEGVSVEEARRQLEESETEGDEKLQTLEDEVKEAKRQLEENQTKLVDAQRKHVVVKRDIEKTVAKAESLEKRVQVLEETIANATDNLKELEEREGESSMKEERNSEEILLLEGQFKEAEVRADAAERSCNVLQLNIQETSAEIQTWITKRERIEKEMEDMDDEADIDD